MNDAQASSAGRYRTTHRWERVAFGLVFLVYVLACFHGIANEWQWGHNGFNGAAFTQAARNSLRFGIVPQAQYHTAATPPPPEALYTHHPLFLHFHLVPLLWLFGDAEWVPRLVPALYSIASLVMLYVFTRRYYGVAIALASAVAFVTIPLNVIFANMINHEQGAIFHCLLFLYAYARFVETPRARWAALALFAITCAVQFDWAAYYLALFVAIHDFLTGVRRQKRLFEIRPEYVFAVALSIVVLANFAAFYAFIVHVRGSFAEMLSSAEQRSSSPGGYWAQTAHRALGLQGPLYLGLLVAFLARFVTRLVRGEAHLGDLLPVFFTAIQVVHSTVFKQAGFIHAYWTYYLNPALAVAAGSVLVGVASSVRAALLWLGRRLASLLEEPVNTATIRFVSVFATLCSVLIVATPLGVQAVDAAKKQRASFENGFGNYVDAYDDQFWLIEWVKDVARRYPRSKREAFLYPGFEYRIEWLYYLDAPRRDVTSLSAVSSMRASDPKRHRLVFVDLARAGSPADLAPLVATHKALLYDGRYLTVDLDDRHAGLIALTPVLGSRPLWYRWLVHPTHPRVLGWRATNPDAEVLLSMATGARSTGEMSFGSFEGGAAGRFDCPDGFAIDAVQTAPARWRGGPTFSGIRARCARVVDDPSASHRRLGPWLGQRGTGAIRTVACAAGSVAIGIEVDTNPYPHGVRLACMKIETLLAGPGDRHAATSTPNRFTCAPGSVAGGLRGNFGLLTDQIGISCVEADPGFLEVARTLRPRGWTAAPSR